MIEKFIINFSKLLYILQIANSLKGYYSDLYGKTTFFSSITTVVAKAKPAAIAHSVKPNAAGIEKIPLTAGTNVIPYKVIQAAKAKITNLLLKKPALILVSTFERAGKT